VSRVSVQKGQCYKSISWPGKWPVIDKCNSAWSAVLASVGKKSGGGQSAIGRLCNHLRKVTWYPYDLSSLQPYRSTHSSDVVTLAHPLLYSFWKVSFPLSAMPHLVLGMNLLKYFTNLLMMSPCLCHLILLTLVYDHHHHYFHCASLLFSSTPDSKLFHKSFSPYHLFGWSTWTF